MTRLIICALVVLAASVLQAQISPTVSYTVGIWPDAVTIGPPLNAVTYPLTAVRCGQPKLPASPLPIVNPTEGRFDDPANLALDCVIDLTAQVAKLAAASGLRAAFRADGASGSGAYGATTDPFERRLGPPNPPLHPRLR